MKRNETRSFLNAINSSDNNGKIPKNTLVHKLQKMMNDYHVERVMKKLVNCDTHVKLTEFLYFVFLLSPEIDEIEIFKILEEYIFGSKQNRELEQYSKINNTFNSFMLNDDIAALYIKKIYSLFTTSKRRKRYRQLINIIEVNEYAASYELFASLLLILVRVNELNNFSTRFLSMESVYNLTVHNRITQLTKKENEIDWAPILKYINPQLRNVSQHFDISYDVENAVYIGKDIKGNLFEITKKDFQEQYLVPLREVVYAVLAVIFLLNISWIDQKKAPDYMNIYISAWKKRDNQRFQEYLNDVVLDKVLNSDKYKNMPFRIKKELRRNDFEKVKKYMPDKYKN
jgi:hypothetical protein